MARETPTLLKRNVLIHGDDKLPPPKFKGEWVAIPREDFDFTRAALLRSGAAPLSERPEYARLREALRRLGMLALQSARYGVDAEFQHATDAALALSEEP